MFSFFPQLSVVPPFLVMVPIDPTRSEACPPGRPGPPRVLSRSLSLVCSFSSFFLLFTNLDPRAAAAGIIGLFRLVRFFACCLASPSSHVLLGSRLFFPRPALPDLVGLSHPRPLFFFLFSTGCLLVPGIGDSHDHILAAAPALRFSSPPPLVKTFCASPLLSWRFMTIPTMVCAPSHALRWIFFPKFWVPSLNFLLGCNAARVSLIPSSPRALPLSFLLAGPIHFCVWNDISFCFVRRDVIL